MGVLVEQNGVAQFGVLFDRRTRPESWIVVSADVVRFVPRIRRIVDVVIECGRTRRIEIRDQPCDGVEDVVPLELVGDRPETDRRPVPIPHNHLQRLTDDSIRARVATISADEHQRRLHFDDDAEFVTHVKERLRGRVMGGPDVVEFASLRGFTSSRVISGGTACPCSAR